MEIVSIWHYIFFGASLIIIAMGPAVFKIYELDRRRYIFLLCGGYLATRIATLIVFYSTGWAGALDNTAFFFPQANNVLDGLIPYLDFDSSYGPYFSYLLAPFVLIYNDTRVIPFALIFFDLLTLLVSDRYVRRTMSDSGRRMFLWTYVFIPTIWFFTVRLNQDEIVLALFVTLSLLLLVTKREELAGLSMGLGFLFTKFLIAVFYIPIIAHAKRKTRTALVAGLVILIGYLPFLILGADILMPLSAETGSRANGGNIWILVEFMGFSTGAVPHIISLLALMVIFAMFLAADSRSVYSELVPVKIRSILGGLGVERRLVLIGLVFMILGKKTWMFYLEIFVVFLIMVFIKTIEDSTNGIEMRLVWALFLGYILVMGVSSYYSSFLLGNIGSPITLDMLASLTVYALAILLQIAMIVLILYHSNRRPHERPEVLGRQTNS